MTPRGYQYGDGQAAQGVRFQVRSHKAVDSGYNPGYTALGMKTAISLPDRVYKSAERVARKLGISRSELYARAIQTYLETFEARRVTEALNQVYARAASELDPVLARIQSASIPRERW